MENTINKLVKAELLLEKKDLKIDELNRNLDKNKEQNLTFKIVVVILLFGFFASIFYNAKLEQRENI